VGSNLVGGYQLLEKKKKPAAYIFRIGTWVSIQSRLLAH
jgi:hypothetical protein